MDPYFDEYSGSMNAFKFDDDTVLPGFDHSMNSPNILKYRDDSSDINFKDLSFIQPTLDFGNFTPSPGSSSEANSPDEQESDPVLKYLNQILLEENMDDKPSMFHDPLALQAAEKSFYDVLGQNYPPSTYKPAPLNVHSPDNLCGSSSEYSTNSSSSGSNSNDHHWFVDPGEHRSSYSQLSSGSENNIGRNNINGNNGNGLTTFSPVVPDIFSDSESIALFKRGMEEASKFLPTGNQLLIDLDKYNLPPKSTGGIPVPAPAPEVTVKREMNERGLPNGSSGRGRKHHELDDSDLEDERSNKQSAVYLDEVEELSEIFDRVLLCTDTNGQTMCCTAEDEPLGLKNFQSNGQVRGPSDDEAVDLRTLLVSCAQSVAADDRRTADEQLNQIRKQSLPSGDTSQRLAAIFADGLEARLAGTGTQLYAASASKQQISAAEKLKAYQVYLSACPFKKISIFFANKMIVEKAKGAKKLHIIDFGIQYGFQWPALIQHISMLPDWSPVLRITGIELPQTGFRPTELVEKTGQRLAKYCERFNIQFKYNAIATQNWETIKPEDLKIEEDEFVAVNCLHRFKNLLDETVMVDSPRDSVLKLIRDINPKIFVHAVISGSYSAPFFVTRFREALFHYSALFDMFDATLGRDVLERFIFEREFYGREVMNVIACEGSERVERPETYKQWQIRNTRAGFKLLPLNQDILKKLMVKVRSGYHKDFLFDQGGRWLLQGWKGRIVCASSCWVPA